jgi:hypothetical protein
MWWWSRTALGFRPARIPPPHPVSHPCRAPVKRPSSIRTHPKNGRIGQGIKNQVIFSCAASVKTAIFQPSSRYTLHVNPRLGGAFHRQHKYRVQPIAKQRGGQRVYRPTRVAARRKEQPRRDTTVGDGANCSKPPALTQRQDRQPRTWTSRIAPVSHSGCCT